MRENAIVSQGQFPLPDEQTETAELSQVAKIIHAIDAICDVDIECHCETDMPCDLDEPLCYPMQIQSLRRSLLALFDYEIRSVCPNRLSNFREHVYVDEFRKLNSRDSASYGMRFLEMLFGVTRKEWRFLPNTIPQTITQRDADVATGIIQWLGTNCGMAFLDTCQRKIEASREFDRKLHRQHNSPEPAQDDIAREAERIAVAFDPNSQKKSTRMWSLRQEIEATMRAIVTGQTKPNSR